jgi:RNA polymerase-interacting CarD/CdnL/TRCF family regulator
MRLTVGNKVNYASQGPCLIRPVVKKVVGGSSTSFYRLAVLDDSGSELFVPVNKPPVGVRRLLEKSEIPKLLRCLKSTGATVKNWKQRLIDNGKLLSSGSAFDLADLIQSLTQLSSTKVLSPRDRQTLDRARKLLICEIAVVLGETKMAATERVDDALKPRNRD